MNPADWRRVMHVYLLFVFAFPLAMAWVTTRPLNGPSICLFRQVTGLDCPTCGMTRSFRSIGLLDIEAAIRYNPLGPAVFLGVVLFWGYATAMVATRGRVRLPVWWHRWKGSILWGGFIVLMIVGFVRIGYQLRNPPQPPTPILQIGDFHWPPPLWRGER